MHWERMIWMDIIMVLAHGCTGNGGARYRGFSPRMLWLTDEVWVKLYGFPLDAPGHAGNDQVFLGSCKRVPLRGLQGLL